MILEQISFTNFGLYRGEQHLRLGCHPDKPVILLGGLNGGGKTTLLDAVQLSLYGRAAKCSSRGNSSYDDFLKKLVHRGVPLDEGAGVSLSFRSVVEGNEHLYRISRSWYDDGKAVKEKVEVYKNGVFDILLSENWGEHVEAFVPNGIASLFFFDGEKIEDLADVKNAAKVLSTAMHSLLGIDILDRLVSDLQIIERRKKAASKDAEGRQAIEQLQGDIGRIEELYTLAFEERAALQNEIERCQKRIDGFEEKYRLEGGDLLKDRTTLVESRKHLESQLAETEGQLRELAAGVTPMLIVDSLLKKIQQRDQQEKLFKENRALTKVLKHRDDQLIQALSKARVAETMMQAARNWLEKDRKERSVGGEATVLDFGEAARQDLSAIRKVIFPDVVGKLRELVSKAEEIQEKLIIVERKLGSIPSEDSLATIEKEINVLRSTLVELNAKGATLDAQLVQLKGEKERKDGRLKGLLEEGLAEVFKEKDKTRVLKHSEKVRSTLDRYRQAVIQQHILKIEQLILESFKQLLRKQTLISEIKINPETFVVELRGQGGLDIPAGRLSAGERQLLATSLLWGLARASGRPLPMIIDTPLGRLDVGHRDHLVERYFPLASHQVILLSTNAEIDKEYYERLKPRIHSSYLLKYDEATRSTKIEPGYFWQ